MISVLGIGGDADASSGDTLFAAVGGGLNFTWVAGQNTVAATHRLSPTPVAPSGPNPTFARGFTYLAVAYMATAGASVDVFWNLHLDFDGKYTFGTDLLGNVYNDSASPSSVRPWIQYEYVPTSTVPEPASLTLLGAGLLGLAARRARRS